MCYRRYCVVALMQVFYVMPVPSRLILLRISMAFTVTCSCALELVSCIFSVLRRRTQFVQIYVLVRVTSVGEDFLLSSLVVTERCMPALFSCYLADGFQ